MFFKYNYKKEKLNKDMKKKQPIIQECGKKQVNTKENE